jgi:hypothetical protein
MSKIGIRLQPPSPGRQRVDTRANLPIELDPNPAAAAASRGTGGGAALVDEILWQLHELTHGRVDGLCSLNITVGAAR